MNKLPQIDNPHNGQWVGKVGWPFYRYTALIPKKIGGDVFVWLYLSLCVYVNESHKWDRNNYSEDLVNEVHQLISTRFSSIIDGQTFEKIRQNAERQFVDTLISHKPQIKEETFFFLNTYENLFSDQVEQKYIFQDAITGEVVPYFDSSSIYLDEWNDASSALKRRDSVKRPSKNSVKKAYNLYTKLKKYQADPESVIQKEEAKGYFDKDEETYFGFDDEEIIEEQETSPMDSKPKNMNDYSVVFLDNSKVVFNVLLDIYVEDNSLVFKTPFENTQQWFSKIVIKAQNVSNDLDAKIKEYSSLYLISKEECHDFYLAHKNDFASSLKYTQTLYRMLQRFDDETLFDHVEKIDRGLRDNVFEFYYPKFGLILERLIKKVPYKDSSAEYRKNCTMEGFYYSIEAKFANHQDIKYSFIKTANIFDDWRKKYRFGKTYSSFKADFVDILLNTTLVDSSMMYPTFVDDVFHLYGLRNSKSHDNDEVVKIDKSELDRLEKVVKVILSIC